MASFATTTIMMFIFYTTVDARNMIRAFGSNVNIPTDCLKILDKGKQSDDMDIRSYCIEKPNNYPQEHVDRHVQDMQTNGFPEQYDTYEDNIFSDDPCDEENRKNCCSKTKMEQPFFVKSESTLKLVIQSKFFQQKLKSTICRDGPQTRCFHDFALTGWQTECVNNMGTTKLYVYNSATNATESVGFSFPVSCSCSIVRINNKRDNK